MHVFQLRQSLSNRPRKISSGAPAYFIPNRLIAKKDELALSMMLVSNRQLFGMIYSGLQPEYFWKMPKGSGVYVGLGLPTRIFSATETGRPGDIDIIIVPYEGDEILLNQIVAIEVKIIRASFAKQSKSPNEFGFSQSQGLKAIGFPYVALAHLIVSDDSPESSWREMGVARIVDRNNRAEMLDPIMTDCLPMDLMDRSFGRLMKLAQDPDLGLISAYINLPGQSLRPGPSFWHPEVRQANANLSVSIETLEKIGRFIEDRPEYFLDNPRYDP